MLVWSSGPEGTPVLSWFRVEGGLGVGVYTKTVTSGELGYKIGDLNLLTVHPYSVFSFVRCTNFVLFVVLLLSTKRLPRLRKRP